MFSSRLPLAERYAALLDSEAVTRGLIGPRETPRMWDRHLLNCAVVGEALAPGLEVADVGSGAGLPGLVLAIARPDLAVTLVEPLLRRTTFLTEVVDELALDNVEVVRGRAEELHGRREFDAVVSRAVAPLDRLGRWCLPLARQGGAMVAMKGSSVEEELAEHREALTRLGGGAATVVRCGVGVLDPPTVVLRVEAARPSRLGLTSTRARGRNRRKGS